MHVTIGPQGRIVIPAAIRDQLHWEPGTDLSVRIIDGELVLADRRAAFQRLKGMLKGKGSVDEFIDERRQAATNE